MSSTPKSAAPFKVGLVQLCMGADPGENLERAKARVEEAARAGAQVVCLPELFRSRYFCQSEEVRHFDLAEPIPGPTTGALAPLAKALGIVLIVPLFERRAPGVYHNSAALIDASGELAGVYRKMHIPDDPAYYEKYYFAPGDLGFKSFQTRVGRLGVLICWDQWYPEGARITALQGASILFFPTAIGWHPREMRSAAALEQLDAWRTVQRGHAVANGVYVAAVNRTGLEKPDSGGEGLEFWGSSFLCDPFGVVQQEAATDREEIVIGDVNPARIEEVRRQWPFLRDRRIDAYDGMLKRFMD